MLRKVNCLIKFLLLCISAYTTSLEKTKHYFHLGNDRDISIEQINYKSIRNKEIPVSSFLNTNVESSRPKSLKPDKKQWNENIKSDNTTGLLVYDGGSNYYIGSKITSQIKDKYKFYSNTSLCNGRWSFKIDREGSLYLKNVNTNIISWVATKSEIYHYGSKMK